MLTLTNTSEREEIEALYRAYGPALRTFFIRRGQTAEIADDLVHEVFVRVHQAARREAVLLNPKAYLFRIASNILVDGFRDSTRLGTLTNVQPYDDSSTSDERPGPDSQVGDEQAVLVLCRTIERLSPKVREALILHKFENLSYQEVADVMGISVRTVEKHLSRALSECRRQLSRGSVPSRVVSFVRGVGPRS